MSHLEVYCKEILQEYSHALFTALVTEDLKTTLHVYKRMYEAVYTCKLIDLSWWSFPFSCDVFLFGAQLAQDAYSGVPRRLGDLCKFPLGCPRNPGRV